MTKDQLKSGMILERRDGKRFLLFRDVYTRSTSDISTNGPDRAVAMDGSGKYFRLLDYSDNLCFLADKREYDIVKVWFPHFLADIFKDHRITADILWERPKEKYTYEQLKMIVGHDFDFVG